MNKRNIGTIYEEQIQKFLKSNKMNVIACNFYCKGGEIDIIGYHEGYLVFVEVKYRTSSLHGFAEDAVSLRKQKCICHAADFYRMKYNIGENTAIRYDVVVIQENQIRWHRDAFPHLELKSRKIYRR